MTGVGDVETPDSVSENGGRFEIQNIQNMLNQKKIYVHVSYIVTILLFETLYM